MLVSTHSRLKAAGVDVQIVHRQVARFNTQPPEGGWPTYAACADFTCGFNTQPPEGGWDIHNVQHGIRQCFNTQPPEGGWSWHWYG